MLTYRYGYDWRGRLSTFATAEGETTYAHDDFGQLTAADHATQPDESYGYDGVGNRTNPGYLTEAPNLVRSDGVRWFDYDANGNRVASTYLATGEVTRYHYDHAGRLVWVEAELPSGVAVGAVGYGYDVYGRRVSRVEYGGSGAVLEDERWAHDGDDVLLKFGPTGAVLERYLYGPGADQLLAVWRYEAGGVQGLWVLSDHQQTVRDVVDRTGAVRKHWAYDSFGNVVAVSGEAGLRFDHLYTGREYDGATGLYFYRARWYDPQVGRFVSRDPLGLAAGDPNLSAYVFNSPLHHTDPSGMIVPLIVGGVVAAGAIYGFIQGYSTGESPSLAYALIPGYGSGQAAGAMFKQKEWFWGSVYSVAALADIAQLALLANWAMKGAGKAASAAPDLIHYTTAEAAERILNTPHKVFMIGKQQWIELPPALVGLRGIYAFSAAGVNNPVFRFVERHMPTLARLYVMLCSGIDWANTAAKVTIPASAATAAGFTRMQPYGFYTLWKWLGNTWVSRPGKLFLGTSMFVNTYPRVPPKYYAHVADAAIHSLYFLVRGAAGLLWGYEYDSQQQEQPVRPTP